MTTVVVGAGAIGLLVAGKLATAGEEVAVVARSGAQALGANGVTVIPRRPGTMPPSPAAVTIAAPDHIPASLRGANVVLAVKGYQAAGALPVLESLEPSQVVTLQNGLGTEEMLVAVLGAERVVAGIITTSVEVHDSTTVAVRREGGIGLAPMFWEQTGSEAAPPVGQLDVLFRRAGLSTRIYADYRAMKWSKALLNILGNATPAILNWDVARVYRQPHLVGLERAIFGEALRTMRALRLAPVDLPRYPVRLLAVAMERLPLPLLRPLLGRVLGGGRGGKAPSLLLDLQRGRQESEAEVLYGAIARAATGAGIPTPANATVHDVLIEIARGTSDWAEWAGRPERLLAAVCERQQGDQV